jgi:hypothetical protein
MPSPRSKKGLQKIALDYLASKFEVGIPYMEKEISKRGTPSAIMRCCAGTLRQVLF